MYGSKHVFGDRANYIYKEQNEVDENFVKMVHCFSKSRTTAYPYGGYRA